MVAMELRHATLVAAIPLAMLVSAISAVVAVTLELVGDVSRPALVACVTLGGFAASWVRSGRTADEFRMRRHAHVEHR